MCCVAGRSMYRSIAAAVDAAFGVAGGCLPLRNTRRRTQGRLVHCLRLGERGVAGLGLDACLWQVLSSTRRSDGRKRASCVWETHLRFWSGIFMDVFLSKRIFFWVNVLRSQSRLQLRLPCSPNGISAVARWSIICPDFVQTKRCEGMDVLDCSLNRRLNRVRRDFEAENGQPCQIRVIAIRA